MPGKRCRHTVDGVGLIPPANKCGQGGLPVLLVDQGNGAGEAFSGLFSEYELLRLSPRASA